MLLLSKELNGYIHWEDDWEDDLDEDGVAASVDDDDTDPDVGDEDPEEP